MVSLQKKWEGLAFCLLLAVPSWFLGRMFPIIGGAVIAIIAGMVIAVFMRNKDGLEDGTKFTPEKVLRWTVILLGFGMNLNVISGTGKQLLSIIVCTITTSLMIAFALHKLIHTPSNIFTLVGVGSSICGGSVIAATALVINADDDKVTRAISVVFFSNTLAAILFPTLGKVLGFGTAFGSAFGVFAGTAISDTSSVIVAVVTWDSIQNLGTATLGEAVTVKLIRTLVIIPITLCLAFIRTRKEEKGDQASGQFVSFKDVFPFFILYFTGVSVVITIATGVGTPTSVFASIKELNKFFIILAMAAIRLDTGPVKLIRTGGKPMPVGACYWVGITVASLGLQGVLGIWQYISI